MMFDFKTVKHDKNAKNQMSFSVKNSRFGADKNVDQLPPVS